MEYSATVVFHHRHKHCISQVKCWAYKCQSFLLFLHFKKITRKHHFWLTRKYCFLRRYEHPFPCLIGKFTKVSTEIPLDFNDV